MKKFNKSPLATVMGTLVVSSFATQAMAEANPFALNELNSGYMQVAVDLNNKVNEAGCGSKTSTKPQADAHKDHETSGKNAEGKCGEGKCGAMMNSGKMKQGMESSCGAMMKNKEGSCGMMNHESASKPDKAAHAGCGAMMKGHAEGSCGAAVDANKAAGK